MNTKKFAGISVVLLIACTGGLYPNEQANGKSDDVWTRAQAFNKSLEDGKLHTPLVDPRYPPQVDFWKVSWNGYDDLTAMAHYYNLGTEPIKVEGREITDSIGVPWFYPFATLEVSDEMKGPWKTIGESPPKEVGDATAMLMLPNGPKSGQFPQNTICSFDMDAFRPWIDKARYGRIVLKGGEQSQVIALVDLLPPEDKLREASTQ